MYDGLIKSLRDMSKMGMKYGMAVITMQEAADAIEKLSRKYIEERNAAVELTGELASKPRWISVKEAPPYKVGDDGYTGYLVYANGYISIADYTTDKYDNVPYFHVDGEYETNVQYYMPLPKPPKEET